MKTWYVVTLVVFALGACVPLGIAGSVYIEEVRYRSDLPRMIDCDQYEYVPFSATEASAIDGSVILRLTNEGPAATARVCLLDDAAIKRLDISVPFEAGQHKDIRVETPPGVYRFLWVVKNDGHGSGGGGILNTGWCLSHTEDVHGSFYVGPDHSMGSVSSGGCIPGTFALGLIGFTGSAFTFALGKFPGLGALLLYSRLAKPRILDNAVRNLVLDLVAREPGIHSREIVRGLDAADGQTAYHLGVLAREKLLTSIGVPGMRHWFVAGRFSPEQMRAIAMLRDPTRRALYDAVVDAPGATLSDVTARVGVSLPAGSRAAKALERAGLIERRAEGRALALRPRVAPADLYGALAPA